MTLFVCFSSLETGRTKTTDYSFEEKIGVLFRFNAGNHFYELKKEDVFLALNDHENSESMLKDLKFKLNFTGYTLCKIFDF